MASFAVEFSCDSSFGLGFSGESSFELDFGSVGGGGAPPWRGEYEATPTWDEQVYGTSGHSMLDDFTVHSIVKQEAPNAAGGLTLSI